MVLPTECVWALLQADDVAALVERLIPQGELAKFQGLLLQGEEQLRLQLERTATQELATSQQQGAGAWRCAAAGQAAQLLQLVC